VGRCRTETLRSLLLRAWRGCWRLPHASRASACFKTPTPTGFPHSPVCEATLHTPHPVCEGYTHEAPHTPSSHNTATRPSHQGVTTLAHRPRVHTAHPCVRALHTLAQRRMCGLKVTHVTPSWSVGWMMEGVMTKHDGDCACDDDVCMAGGMWGCGINWCLAGNFRQRV
jgi:hypothetical protein